MDAGNGWRVGAACDEKSAWAPGLSDVMVGVGVKKQQKMCSTHEDGGGVDEVKAKNCVPHRRCGSPDPQPPDLTCFRDRLFTEGIELK